MTPPTWEAGLVAFHRRVQEERMAGVALLNPVLMVAAIGFHDHPLGRLGILLTPWCMNLVLRPLDDCAAPGTERERTLSAGHVTFLGYSVEPLGGYEAASLLTTMEELEDQPTACAVAEAALAALLRPPPPQEDASRRDFLRSLLPQAQR